MIGESQKSSENGVNKGLIALRDSIIVFFLFLITRLVEAGYPPTIEVVYTCFLAAALMAIISYMHALGIQKPEQ